MFKKHYTVKFLQKRLLYLSRYDVETVGMTMAEIIDVLEQAFREKGEGRLQMPPKPAIHPGGGEDNFIHAMPAYLPRLQMAGVKWVSGYPRNHERGLPYISGLIVINDPATGLPVSVMDCVWITAMRTGAATAVAARYLARGDSTVLGILGCGVQGRTNVEALKVLFPLKRVMAYDVDAGAARRFADDIAARFGLEAVVVKTAREAVSGCDMVVTAGPILKKPHCTIQAGWMEEGTFASLVDFDSYWHPDAMREAAKFCTDDVPQLRHYQTMGYFQDIPPVHADLGELVARRKGGRNTTAERTITANLGLAMDDIAVAPYIYKRALENGIGTWLML